MTEAGFLAFFLAQSTFHVLFRNGCEVGILGAKQTNDVKIRGVREGMAQSDDNSKGEFKSPGL